MSRARRFARPDVLDRIPLASHAWIEASAGTGKTFTLEHLIVDLIVRAGARLDEILVLTFTEKATLEMRERVRATLVALVHAGPDDARVDPPPGANAWTLDEGALERLRDAVEGFEAASIHTIHGYCQRVLKEHAFHSRDLFVQELADTRPHFRRGVRAVLREALRPGDPAHELLRAALDGRAPSDLADLLFDWAAEPGVLMPPASLARVHEAARRCADEALRDGLLAAAREEGARTRAPLGEHMEALHACALDVAAASDLMQAMRAVEGWTSRMQGKKALPEWLAERRAKNPALHAALAPYDALLESVPHFPMLVVQTLLPRVLAKVDVSKRAAGEMDFDDLLTRVRDALDGEGGQRLAAALAAQHRFAIVDEFQDTDVTQWTIFRTLFFEGNEEPTRVPLARRRALYLIGDPKQAIYTFRGADVHTYLAARAQLAAHAEHVVLDQNFRSTAAVIRAYNAIFARGFFEGPIRYDAPVTCGDGRLRARHPGGSDAVPLVLLRPRAARSDDKLSAEGVRELLADTVGLEIERLLADGPAALEVGPEGALRRLRPSDIYVLGRNASDLEGVHDRLAARGIPCAYFKRRGLFGTREAADLLMVLRAVQDPSDRSHRLKAWLTPFFGLQLTDLRGDVELDDDHPLVARLVRLRERCEARDYAAFAHELLHESGLTRRELFLEEGARRLTNYQHLVDVVLQHAHGRRRTVGELVVDFQRLVEGKAGPQVEDDVERAASEGSAVQLLTMHKSKGLEAEVVFVLGGLSSSDRPGARPRVRHARGTREAWMRPLSAAVSEDVARELAEEDERLFYVALTRARSRLYLPYFGAGKEERGAGGDYALRAGAAYEVVNRALASLVTGAEGERRDEHEAPVEGTPPAWLELRVVSGDQRDASESPGPTPLASSPAARVALTSAPADPASDPASRPGARAGVAPAAARVPLPQPLDASVFAALRRRHRGPLATSYTRMQGRRARQLNEAAPHEEFQGDVHDTLSPLGARAEESTPTPAGPSRALQRLPGGASTGIFLHEALERADLGFFASLGGAEEALVREPGSAELRALLAACAARNGVSIEHIEASAELVFHALRTPLPTRGGAGLALVDASRVVREMSFQFPIPEAEHPSLASARGPSVSVPRGELPFRVERGVVRGVVDVVFEHDGAIYFLDWKSDRVSGGEAALAAHVADHYALQIQLYTLGLLRLLDVWDEPTYERRFGGHLYAFLRPLAAGEPGVVFERPSFADVQRWERELLATSFGSEMSSAGAEVTS